MDPDPAGHALTWLRRARAAFQRLRDGQGAPGPRELAELIDALSVLIRSRRRVGAAPVEGDLSAWSPAFRVFLARERVHGQHAAQREPGCPVCEEGTAPEAGG
jgi:hypothetical protein